MKKLFCLLSVLLVAFCIVGCLPQKEDNWTVRDDTMVLKIGNYSFEVDLAENDTVDALLDILPLDVNMSELNGNEKYFNLDVSLPTDAKNIGQINAGDIMLWGNNCLVIFYKSFSTSYSYTRIGHIKDTTQLQKAVGTGRVQVKWVVS